MYVIVEITFLNMSSQRFEKEHEERETDDIFIPKIIYYFSFYLFQ